jgi:hypothetical protein
MIRAGGMIERRRLAAAVAVVVVVVVIVIAIVIVVVRGARRGDRPVRGVRVIAVVVGEVEVREDLHAEEPHHARREREPAPR